MKSPLAVFSADTLVTASCPYLLAIGLLVLCIAWSALDIEKKLLSPPDLGTFSINVAVFLANDFLPSPLATAENVVPNKGKATPNIVPYIAMSLALSSILTPASA